MRIQTVELRWVEMMSRHGRRPDGNLAVHDHPVPQPELLLTITTDEGPSGTAVAEDPMVRDAFAGRERAVLDLLGFVLVGRDPHDRNGLWRDLRRLQRLHLTSIADRTLHLVDLALWDLAARAAGLPVYKYIGAARDRVPAYASTVVPSLDDPYLRTADDFADLAERCVELGFRAFKLHTWSDWDESQRSVVRDIEAAERVRSRVGPDIELMMDPFHFYSRAEALTLGRALAELDFHWLEEPMDEDSMSAYAWLRDRVEVPIAGPEVAEGKVSTRAEWIAHGACDYARVGSIDVGGITPMLKVIGLCDAFNVPLTFHLGGLSSLHAIASMAAPGAMFEYGLLHPAELGAEGHPPWLEAPAYGLADDGHVDLPQVPGLGWRIDWDWVRANTSVAITTDQQGAS